MRDTSAVLVLLQRLNVWGASRSATPSKILHILFNILHILSNILHTLSNILHNSSNILHTLSNILRTPSNILHIPSNILYTSSNILRNPSNFLQTPSNILCKPYCGLHSKGTGMPLPSAVSCIPGISTQQSTCACVVKSSSEASKCF